MWEHMLTDDDSIDENVLNRLKQISTPAVADTKHDSISVLTSSIKPVHTDCTIAGTVRTVKLDPSALWAPVQTLDNAREDDVIVVDTGNCIEEAVWGELLSTYAATNGIAGMVTDGAVRDISGIRDIEFPVFAQAHTPRGPSGHKEVETDVQVSVGEALIHPRDILIGDESGVVVIKHNAVDEVITAAEAVGETEREVERQIDEGKSLEGAFKGAGMG